jgi:hypothetical protein
MLKKQFVPIALFGLLLASPMAMAEEAHHPEKGAATAGESAGAEESAEVGGGVMPTDPGAMMMGGRQGEESPPIGSTMGPGMMMGKPCMMGGPGGVMMPMMMGKQQGRGAGMMMGRGGMMGMMHGGKGGGMMGYGGHGGGKGHGMHEKHRKLIGRLDLLEARLAKIETMLERLLQR